MPRDPVEERRRSCAEREARLMRVRTACEQRARVTELQAERIAAIRAELEKGYDAQARIWSATFVKPR